MESLHVHQIIYTMHRDLPISNLKKKTVRAKLITMQQALNYIPIVIHIYYVILCVQQ